jgi:hypothetical protein
MVFLDMLLTDTISGRAAREEEEAKGQSIQAHGLHSPFRKCYNDWWQAKGIFFNLYANTCKDANSPLDEPQPNHINSQHQRMGEVRRGPNVWHLFIQIRRIRS